MSITLSAIGAWLIGVLSKDILAFLWSLLSQAYSNWQAQKAVAQQAQADASALAAAKTAQEKIDAANAINHDTFGS